MAVRGLGYVFLLLAVAAAGYEVFLVFENREYRTVALGEIWFRADQMFQTGSLNLSQAVVQRYVSAWLWEAVLQRVLGFPAWSVFGVIGLALWWAGFRRRRRFLTFRR